jgi:hypothetical protein
MSEYRVCLSCQTGYWPGQGSHPEWCSPCASLNDAGRERRLDALIKAARRRADLAAKAPPPLGTEG